MIIEHLTLPTGRELKNVPASPIVLEELGVPAKQIERLMLEQAKKATQREVQTVTKAARARLTGRVDVYTLMHWNEKAARARRVLADTASDDDTAVLTAEISGRSRGETPKELAQKQVDKSMALASAMATIDGIESAALESIDQQPTMHALHVLVADLERRLEDAYKKARGNNG